MITEITLITIAAILAFTNILTLVYFFRIKKRNTVLEQNANQEVQRVLGELLTSGYGVFEINAIDYTQFYLKR